MLSDQNIYEGRAARDRRHIGVLSERLDALYGTERPIGHDGCAVVFATGSRALLASAMGLEPDPFCAGSTL